jgi:hypothetical protein
MLQSFLKNETLYDYIYNGCDCIYIPKKLSLDFYAPNELLNYFYVSSMLYIHWFQMLLIKICGNIMYARTYKNLMNN